MNIPIIFNKSVDFKDFSHNNLDSIYKKLINSNIFDKDNQKLYLCHINLNINRNDMNIIIDYNDWYNNDLKTQLDKLKYLSIIHDRTLILQDEYFKEINKIKDKYYNLINKIDNVNCYNIWQKEQKEYDNIQDELKFEIGLKYIFDDYIRFNYSNSRWDIYYIKSLQIIRTTPKYVFIKIQTKKSSMEFRVKKYKILNILRKNKYTFEKNVERTKKIKRLLSQMN